jgi:hypothetical protein
VLAALGEPRLWRDTESRKTPFNSTQKYEYTIPELMNIKFHHYPFKQGDNITNETGLNNENEELVDKINIIMQLKRNKDILFYLDRLNIKPVGGEARVYPNSWKQDKPLESIEEKISGIKRDYLVYISKNVRTSNDAIYKTLYFAHELQHIQQYEENRKIWILGSIFLYSLGDLITNFNYFQIPMEYDAERVTKIIMIQIYGQSEIQNWISKKICETDAIDKKKVWNILNNINISKDYNVLQESTELWEKHKNDIRTYADKRRKESLIKALEEFDKET